MPSLARPPATAIAPAPPPFDRILCRTQLLEAFRPLVADFEAALDLVADLDPQDATRTLTSRVETYLDVLADALGSAVPAGRWAA